jgi:hypothetical protein
VKPLLSGYEPKLVLKQWHQKQEKPSQSKKLA